MCAYVYCACVCVRACVCVSVRACMCVCVCVELFLSVQLFFEGVESLLASGTKADEVGFRLDYSRGELRKCIKEYPGKEVMLYI